jgi:transposase InsO family protein
MGRVGACADNAAMESFFSLLQKNVLDRQRWTTGRNSDWPSRPGSKGHTTAGDGKGGWENSRPSNMKQSTGPRS